MAKFTYADALAAAQSAGFSGDDASTAAAIALAESGGNAAAVSPRNTNGTVDRGAWQINSVHAAILRTGNPLVLSDNARMAYAVYKAQGFDAWTTYKTGAYKPFLPADTTPAVSVAASLNPLAGLEGAASQLGDRFGKIGSDFLSGLLAVVLLALGVVILLRNSEGAKVAKGAALAATKVVTKL